MCAVHVCSYAYAKITQQALKVQINASSDKATKLCDIAVGCLPLCLFNKYIVASVAIN